MEFILQKFMEFISQNIIWTIFIIFLITTLPMKLIFHLYSRNFLIKHWGEYARKRNFRLQKRWFLFSPRVAGNYEGFDYLLYKDIVNNSRISTHTYITLTLPFIAETGGFQFDNRVKFIFRIGREQIKTGDKEFDKKFTIVASKPERTKELFTPRFRKRLLDFPRDMRVEVNYNKIIFRMRLVTKDFDLLDTTNELLATLARKLGGEKEVDSKTTCPCCKKEVLSYYKFCKYCGGSL